MVVLKAKPHANYYLKADRLSEQLWGRHLWARGYFAASSGNVTDEVTMQYIVMQDLKERARNDGFTVG